MEIEQLKLVLETIKTVSGDAQVVAIVWLLVTGVFPYLVGGAVAYLIYRAVIRIFESGVSEKSNTQGMAHLFEIIYGYPPSHGYCSREEITKITNVIRHLKHRADSEPPPPPANKII